MSNTSKIILVTIIAVCILLGLGYAAIQNITLNIAGTAVANADQTSFKVKFVGTPAVSNGENISASIIDDTNATIGVTGLTEAGQYITATYEVKNESGDLSADLKVATTNDNPEFFKISSLLAKTSLTAGETTTVLVTVELIKTPITQSESANIGVELIAMPVQPGEEGTSDVNDYSETPLEINEYGFYYDKAYTSTMDGDVVAIVFREDTSAEMYMNGMIMQQAPAGLIVYGDSQIDATNAGYGLITVSPDGKQITLYQDTLVLDSSYDVPGTTVPEGAMYIRRYIDPETNTETFVKLDKMPITVENDDLYIYGDYAYSYGDYITGLGWGVTVVEKDYVENLGNFLGVELEGGAIDRKQTTYGPILEYINGYPITSMGETFYDCSEMVVTPEIPDTVKGWGYAFKGCTSLTTVTNIPSSLTSMFNAFEGCTSLKTLPRIPEGVTDMSYAFYGCTSLEGEIEINVVNLKDYADCFKGVDMSKITLTGTASKEIKNLLGSTGLNYTPIP